MERLDSEFANFLSALRCFEIPSPVIYGLQQLKLNTDWPWGYATGLYCFVSKGEIVYVGRAIGPGGLGSRIASHLGRTELDWVPVLSDPDATVWTFSFDKADAHLVGALEIHLICALDPILNHRCG